MGWWRGTTRGIDARPARFSTHPSDRILRDPRCRPRTAGLGGTRPAHRNAARLRLADRPTRRPERGLAVLAPRCPVGERWTKLGRVPRWRRPWRRIAPRGEQRRARLCGLPQRPAGLVVSLDDLLKDHPGC